MTVPNEFWIVVSQYDSKPTGLQHSGPPRGPIVHESYCLTEDEAIKRAETLGDRFGWTIIMRVDSDAGRQELRPRTRPLIENKAIQDQCSPMPNPMMPHPAQPSPSMWIATKPCTRCGKPIYIDRDLCAQCHIHVHSK